MNKIKKVWIWSPKIDFSLLLVPIIISLIFAFSVPGLKNNDLDLKYLYFHYVLIDLPHVFASFFILATDKLFLKKHWNIVLLCFISGILLNSSYFLFGPFVFFLIFRLFNHFHFIRQDWGWLCIGNKNASSTPISLTEKLMLYFPMIYYLSNPHKNEILFITLTLIGLGIFIHYIFLLNQQIKSTQIFPIGKVLLLFTVWCKTLFAYFVGHWNILFIYSALLLHHSIPFYYHAFQHELKKNSFEAKTKAALLLVYFFCVLISFFSYPLLPQMNSGSFEVLLIFLYFPSFFHYLIDGFYWKNKYAKI